MATGLWPREPGMATGLWPREPGMATGLWPRELGMATGLWPREKWMATGLWHDGFGVVARWLRGLEEKYCDTQGRAGPSSPRPPHADCGQIPYPHPAPPIVAPKSALLESILRGRRQKPFAPQIVAKRRGRASYVFNPRVARRPAPGCEP